MDQGSIKIKLSEKSRRKKETDTYKKKMKEEKGKRDFIGFKLVFPVKKMNSAISGVFRRKKTFAGENRGRIDDSAIEITYADETLTLGKTKTKRNPLQKKKSFWESARVRVKIFILGQRLKTRTKRSLSESIVEEELCKKRILMGERCKPMNRSGLLRYDADGIILPEP